MLVTILGHDRFPKESFQLVIYQPTCHLLHETKDYILHYILFLKNRETALRRVYVHFDRIRTEQHVGLHQVVHITRGIHLTAILTMVPSISWHYVTCCT
jgi:hypothetical protein